MNWKQHLIFSPELPTISKDAENLIRRYTIRQYCDIATVSE